MDMRGTEMTDRVHSFLVVLEDDIREDDMKYTIMAIHQIKGVIKVIPNVQDTNETVAEVRIRTRLLNRMLKILED